MSGTDPKTKKPAPDDNAVSKQQGNSTGLDWETWCGNAGTNGNHLVTGRGNDKPADKDKSKEPEKNADGTPKEEESWFTKFFKGLNIGNITGSALGAGLLYMLGSLFGDGIVGKFMKWALVPAGAIIGYNWGDKTINGWLHRPSSGEKDIAGADPKKDTQPKDKTQSPADTKTTAGNAAEEYEVYRKTLEELGVKPPERTAANNKAPDRSEEYQTYLNTLARLGQPLPNQKLPTKDIQTPPDNSGYTPGADKRPTLVPSYLVK